MTIRALCLKQPYANWVVSGRKRLETRTWRTRHRGPLLIVASRSGAGEPRGCLVGAVVVTGCRPMIRADERAACVRLYPRAQAWTLRFPLRLPPVPVRGRLGLFPLRVDGRAGPALSRWLSRRSRRGAAGTGRRVGSRAGGRTRR